MAVAELDRLRELERLARAARPHLDCADPQFVVEREYAGVKSGHMAPCGTCPVCLLDRALGER